MCLQTVSRVRKSKGEGWGWTVWKSRQMCPNHSPPLLMKLFSPSVSLAFPWKLCLHHPALCHLIALKHFPIRYPRGSLSICHLYALFLEKCQSIGSLKWWKVFTVIPSINVVFCFFLFYDVLLLESREEVKISESATIPISLDK